MKTPFVIFVVGPTASGKSSIALQLAENLGGEIINADSIQVYENLNIGSAKPSVEEMSRVRHHLIGHVEEGKKYTAGQFREDVLKVLEERIRDGQNLFFVVGGSGFYLRALVTGLYQIPHIPEGVSKKIEPMSQMERFELLKKIDPEYAKKINVNDTYRISRALEVCLTTEKTFSEFQKNFSQKDFPYTCVKIGLKAEKAILRERVTVRAQKMLDAGLVEEVQALLKKGMRDWAPLESVGYKEVKNYIEGKLPKEKLLEEIVKSTMALVKKQMTWFKKDTEIHWFDISTPTSQIEATLKKYISP